MNSLTSPRSLSLSGKAIPSKLLNDLMIRQVTGKLTIQNPFDEFVSWQVYIGNGKINFANSISGTKERVKYLAGNNLDQLHINLPQKISNDYNYLCKLWKKEALSFSQTRSILTHFANEALVHILSLPHSHCTFSKDDHLQTLFLNLDFQQSITSLKNKISCWQALHSEVNSPFQRPLVENWGSLSRALVKFQQRGQNLLNGLHQSMGDLDCLYGIASKTQLSTLQLALMMRPLIKTGEITMLPYQEIQSDRRPLAVCVNTRPVIQRILRSILEKVGFRTHHLDDPDKALLTLLGKKPQLIILDEQIQHMSGYQLCSLCRKSGGLNDVPILIMGEKDFITNQIYAKLSGASGYLDQAYSSQELIKAIQKYLLLAIPA